MYCFFFFKQKTAYEMRISDWSSDVCSSDLLAANLSAAFVEAGHRSTMLALCDAAAIGNPLDYEAAFKQRVSDAGSERSEEHTSELQSLMRISYAVFCLKKKKKYNITTRTHQDL